MGNTNHPNPNVNRSFLLRWVLANLVGLPGLLLPYGIGIVIRMSLIIMSDGAAVGTTWDLLLFGILALSGALVGLWLGWLQSLTLKTQMAKSGRWIDASALAVAIGVPLGWFGHAWFLDSPIVQRLDGMNNAYYSVEFANLFFGILLSLTLGVSQWFVLRQRVYRAGWWLIVVPECFILGVWFTNFSRSTPHMPVFWAEFSPLIALVGISCITGVLLKWLLQFPKRQREGQ